MQFVYIYGCYRFLTQSYLEAMKTQHDEQTLQRLFILIAYLVCTSFIYLIIWRPYAETINRDVRRGEGRSGVLVIIVALENEVYAEYDPAQGDTEGQKSADVYEETVYEKEHVDHLCGRLKVEG